MDQPCQWEIETACCSGWDDFTPAQQELAFELATLTLWAATGRRYGLCEITVQPCRQRPRLPLYQTFPVPEFGYGIEGRGQGIVGPVLEDGTWFNRCGPGCSCAASCEVLLRGPTTTDNVAQVRVEGAVVDPDAYQIQDNHRLVRIDGQCWPSCIDYSDQTPPEFEVTYLRGKELPDALKTAAGILACEYARACAGDKGCRLPTRLTSLTRAGVSVDVQAIDSYLDLGLTTIPEVDRVIVALNPYRITERPRITSPDRKAPRMVT